MTQQEADELKNNGTEPENTAGEEAEDPGQALAEERKKAEEYLANWQRAQADFINYKRRTEQERQEFAQYANSELLHSILPVLDDLDRALDTAALGKSAKHSWLEGVRLVDRKLRSILEKHGVKPIEALGEPFDPTFHEALRQAPGKEGTVIEEYQKGYMMHDKLLRPARVVVGNGEPAGEETKEDS
jgi:molecular chaperone GrpE